MAAFTRFALVVTTVLTTAIATATQSQGALLASDDFSTYTPGTSLSGLNGGTGWNGGYTVGAPGSGFLNEVRDGVPLSYPNYPAVGGNYANLAAGYGGPQFNYFQRTVDVAGAFAAYSDGVRVGANNTTIWGSFAYHEANDPVQFWLQGSANKLFYDLPTSGSDSLLVYRIEFGAADADTVTIWNNPNLTTFTPLTPATAVVAGDYSFQTLVFVADGEANEARFDNIRLGDQLADVVPVSAAVPEPTTLSLLGVAGLLALRRRK